MLALSPRSRRVPWSAHIMQNSLFTDKNMYFYPINMSLPHLENVCLKVKKLKLTVKLKYYCYVCPILI